MSKIPAALRTARCSSIILVYWTGISQPPNSMSLAPSFWWAEKSGVRFIFRGGNIKGARGRVKREGGSFSPSMVAGSLGKNIFGLIWLNQAPVLESKSEERREESGFHSQRTEDFGC